MRGHEYEVALKFLDWFVDDLLFEQRVIWKKKKMKTTKSTLKSDSCTNDYYYLSLLSTTSAR